MRTYDCRVRNRRRWENVVSRHFSIEFKRESAGLVLDQGYSILEAVQAIGVGETALRRWVKQLADERGGITPKGSKALTAEQQQIQELEGKVRQLEREKSILKNCPLF